MGVIGRERETADSAETLIQHKRREGGREERGVDVVEEGDSRTDMSWLGGGQAG